MQPGLLPTRTQCRRRRRYCQSAPAATAPANRLHATHAASAFWSLPLKEAAACFGVPTTVVDFETEGLQAMSAADLAICHGGSQCVNTIGGYECRCPASNPNCTLGNLQRTKNLKFS